VLPMTHLIPIVRPLTTGQGVALAPLLGHSAYLLALASLAFVLAYRKLESRMFD
jgi:hypothetical protein